MEKKKRVLIVDDEHSIVEMLSYRLLNRGFEVVTASNAWEFWGEAMSIRPDLIILDIWLQGKLGTEVYNELLANGLDPDVPVIFITALLEDRPASHARPGIKFALYGKPFNFDELMKGIDSLLKDAENKGSSQKTQSASTLTNSWSDDNFLRQKREER